MMVRRSWSLLGICLLFLSSGATAGVAALVDADWLEANRQEPGIVLLDIQEEKAFARYHLPGALSAPYSRWRTREGMYPGKERLVAYLGRLGISASDHLVIISTGLSAGDMAASARVYWTLYMLGHPAMSVMNGGLADYARQYGMKGLTSGATAKPAVTVYKPAAASQKPLDAGEVAAALKRGDQGVDARSVAEYLGLRRGGPKERPGTLPGALNLPYDWLTVAGGGELLPIPAIKRLMAAQSIPQGGAQIHFCHTGSRAALTWFVDHALLGNGEARLYDGSMAEWARRRDLPIEVKLDLGSADP